MNTSVTGLINFVGDCAVCVHGDLYLIETSLGELVLHQLLDN